MDPIEKFLRSIDNSRASEHMADGYQLDAHDVAHCTLKGSRCVFLPSATGRVAWDCWVVSVTGAAFVSMCHISCFSPFFFFGTVDTDALFRPAPRM